MKKRRQPRRVGPAWLRWVLFAAASACMGLAVTAAVQWVVTGSLSIVREWALKYPGHLLLTALLYATAVDLLGTILGRLWLSGALVGFAGLGLGLVDFLKTAINGMPLSVEDFGLATQLGQVMGVAGELTPPGDFWRAGGVLALCVLLLALTAPLIRLESRSRFLQLGLALSLSVVLFTGGGLREKLGELFRVDVYTRLDTATNHDTYGLTLSLWRDCFMEPKAQPQGYSQAYMEQVLARIDALLAEEETVGWAQALGEEDGAGKKGAVTDSETTARTQPNVIMILSESFFDLTDLPELTYEADPLKNFHALAEEGISGTFHSHYLGYGTGYLEMAMLSGLTGMDFGPGTNICFLEEETYQRFDSLAEQYTASGAYAAEMLHGYNNTLYNRTVTYPLLGFSGLLFSQDVQSLGLEWEGSVYGGYYLKDAYLFDGLLERMEAINAGGQRAFLYGITMENHQPFDPEKFGYACQIGVSTSELSEENMEIVRVMVEGITRADQALGRLSEALRQSPEPTIVVFFGDHRPNLFMADGETVYTKLGLCPENDVQSWTAEQVNALYATDYLIWANDAALLQGRDGEVQESSITAIGPQLLELMGQPVSRYWALAGKLNQFRLTETERYFVDGAGQAYTDRAEAGLCAEAEELLALREAVIYDALYGQQYITAAMNRPVGN